MMRSVSSSKNPAVPSKPGRTSHAGNLPRSIELDPAQLPMGDATAYKHRLQATRHRDIGDVAPFSGNQARVLYPRDAAANVAHRACLFFADGAVLGKQSSYQPFTRADYSSLPPGPGPPILATPNPIITIFIPLYRGGDGDDTQAGGAVGEVSTGVFSWW